MNRRSFLRTVPPLAAASVAVTAAGRPSSPWSPPAPSDPAIDEAVAALGVAFDRLSSLQERYEALPSGEQLSPGTPHGLKPSGFYFSTLLPAIQEMEAAEAGLLALMRARELPAVACDGWVYLDLDEILNLDPTGELRSVNVAWMPL